MQLVEPIDRTERKTIDSRKPLYEMVNQEWLNANGENLGAFAPVDGRQTEYLIAVLSKSSTLAMLNIQVAQRIHSAIFPPRNTSAEKLDPVHEMNEPEDGARFGQLFCLCQYVF